MKANPLPKILTKPEPNRRKIVNRRDFIKKVSIGAAGFSVPGSVGAVADEWGNGTYTPTLLPDYECGEWKFGTYEKIGDLVTYFVEGGYFRIDDLPFTDCEMVFDTLDGSTVEITGPGFNFTE